MTRLYVTLSIIGWVWLVALLGYVWYRTRRDRGTETARGFEVQTTDVEPRD